MTEENIVWLAVSLLAGVGSVPVGYLVVFVLDRIEKLRRPANVSAPLFIERVFVASDLMPLIGGLANAGIPFDGSELRLFGSDGRYVVNSKSKKWRAKMYDWAAKGLKIRYILLDADKEVQEALFELKREMGDRFDAVALNEGALPDIARELETCHPTIFLGKGGENAAWIEGFHPRDSIHAYDVEYISPSAIKRSRSAKDTFEHYAAKVDAVLENSHPLVDASPVKR